MYFSLSCDFQDREKGHIDVAMLPVGESYMQRQGFTKACSEPCLGHGWARPTPEGGRR